MFVFENTKPNRRGQVSHYDVPLGQFLGEAWDQGVDFSMGSSISRMGELYGAKNPNGLFGLLDNNAGRTLTSEEANTKAHGLGLDLAFEEDITEGGFNVLARRKKDERRRNFILNQSGDGAGRFAASMGVQMMASMANPIDFALMFTPIVGSARLAKGAAMLGRGKFSRAITRGLVTTTEKLGASRVPFPTIVAAAIDGTIGSAIAEIPISIAKHSEQANYTMSDSFINIAAGGVLSAGFRTALSGAARVYRGLTKQTKSIMFKRALHQFAKGEDFDVNKYVDIDENTLRAKVQYDEQASRRRSQNQASPHNSAEDRLPFAHHKDRPGDLHTLTLKQGDEIPEGYTLVEVKGDEMVVAKVQEVKDILAKEQRLKNPATFDDLVTVVDAAIKHIDKIGMRTWNLDPGEIDLRQFLHDPDFRAYLQGLGFDGFVGFGETRLNRTGDLGNPEVIPFTREGIKNARRARNAKVKVLREKSAESFLANERKQWDPELQFQKLRRAEIEKQIADGKTLKGEDIDNFFPRDKVSERDVNILEKDADNILDELGDLTATEKKDLGKLFEADEGAIAAGIACVTINA